MRLERPVLLLLVLMVFAAPLAGQDRGRYLIVTPDQFVDAARPLAEWKTRKGMLARIAPLSETGSSSSEIRNFILNAYNNWPVPPEYVLILGGPSQVPGYSYSTDDGYGDMSGSYQWEIPVGRLPCTSVRECSTVVNKVLAYERLTGPAGLDWLGKGCTTLREDNDPPDDSIYWSNSRLCHDYWRGAGYTHIDSMSRLRGHNSSDATAALNDGRAFITYRGQGVGSWWTPFNSINWSGLQNSGMTPVVVGATCSTMDLEPGGGNVYGDRSVRAGDPDDPRGGIAYFGTTGVVTHGAHYRGAVHVGFFNALYAEKGQQLGYAAMRGKYRVDSLYHQQARYSEWVLFGDPEMGVWSAPPDAPEVDYDSVVILAPQTCTVTVRVNSAPFAGALVCMSMDSVVYEYGYTDGSGKVMLDINPTRVGALDLVVTGRNLKPLEEQVGVVPGGVPYIVSAGQVVDDYAGNHDGIPNPGERFRLNIELQNIGGVTAPGVEGLLRTDEPGTVIHDSTSSYGSILPDSTSSGDGFDLALDSTYREGKVVPLDLLAWDASGDSWSLGVNLVVRAARFEVLHAELLDSLPGGNGNGRLGRGESGRYQLLLVNSGGGGIEGATGLLRSLDTNVVVLDSMVWYGRVRAGDTIPEDADCFALSAGPGLATGNPVSLVVGFEGDGESYRYSDTVELSLETETGGTADPTGPDAYGYWCYDNTDTSSGRAPTYDWMDLAPPGPGVFMPVVSDSDAATRTWNLPFPFKYYGQDYTTISVCSNGFLALGTTSYRYGSNRSLPDASGAPAMVCPFWDDLNPDEGRNGYGTAYLYYDTTGHRWMVQFDQFAHYNQPGIRETFQVILHDPAHHTTPTGDGDIVFQYEQVALNSGCTVGIEDHTDTRAIQYLYNNSYDENAAWLNAQRAIRFTTLPPVSSVQPWLLPAGVFVSDTAQGNGNGVFESGETLQVYVTVENRGEADADSTGALLRSLDPDATVLDSQAWLGLVPAGGQATTADEFVFSITELPGDSVVSFELVFDAGEYVTTGYFAVGIGDFTGVYELGRTAGIRTGLGRVRPNPARDRAYVRYSLARAGHVDLALFDATGRRVRTLSRGAQPAGHHSVSVPTGGLSQGVYFCRMTVADATGPRRFTTRLQVAR